MTKAQPKTALGHILKSGICPIILDPEIMRIVAKNTKQIGQILSENGIYALEIADREPSGIMMDMFEPVLTGLDAYGIFVGVGTVTSIPQAERARRAGAHFVVSPNFAEAVSYYCEAYPGFPYVPTAKTTTELTSVYKRGWETVKYYPASSAHEFADIRRSMARELPNLAIIASGMEKPKDKDLYEVVRPWYAAKANAIVYGSQIFDPVTLASGDWKQFALDVKKLVNVVSLARSHRH